MNPHPAGSRPRLVVAGLPLPLLLLGLLVVHFAAGTIPSPALADDEIKSAHVYHNHMPNFWPYYDTAQYDSTPLGGAIRYLYDGQVIELKRNPPPGYPYYLPNNGGPMPHDDLEGGGYYPHHAKYGAYQHWPHSVAWDLRNNHPRAQMHVTMSASVINNVDSIIATGTIPNYYNDPNWGGPWRNAYTGALTSGGHRTLDLIHFTGHHTMGPLTGNEYFLKDLIYHNATVARDYFIGGADFRSSKGFFPTELGFSTRLVPALKKLGIEWSVLGNVHYSRTLRDYPYLDQPGADMMTSPPNRADLRNTSNIGAWVQQNMFNEQHVMYNKYPFASTPHWVKYVDPATGEEQRIAGIPVDQDGSWEEGYQGSVTATDLVPFIGVDSRPQYFVLAHDGDNSSGRAGSEETWRNAGNVTYSQGHTEGLGIDEYLAAHPIPADDVAHVQDGSWIDTRDSASDPSWYHWHLPFGIWKGQFPLFNQVTGLDLSPKTNLSGIEEGMTVSLEHGWHYLERNFALLQPALNYAATAEQIWLDAHPNHWSPSTALDHEITHPGNQLNPWMLSYPVKGDAANDWAGGANPAELAWYFLLASIDSGFGYYDENQDDHVKPTISLNQSLYFSEPYVDARAAQDATGPSVWWPQRWPYNPGSANVSKAEGWTLHHFDNAFAIYTFAYDLSGITDIKVKVRVHNQSLADVDDNTYQVYDPAALAAQGVPDIDPSRVGPWTAYPMTVRDLDPEINGVDWQPTTKEVMQIVPARKIGDLYYTYFTGYRDQLLDYYIEAVDSRGNLTRTEIQQVYVGAGRYRQENGQYVEDAAGPIEGTHPFLDVVDPEQPPSAPQGLAATADFEEVSLGWSAPGFADTYTLHFTDDGSDPATSPTASTIPGLVSPYYLHGSLVNGVTYTYRVSATNAYGESPLSALVTATPWNSHVPPSTPTNLAAVVGNLSVTLTWDPVADADGYELVYTVDGGTATVLTAIASPYVHDNLTAGSTYAYRVRAVNTWGASPSSSEVTAVPVVAHATVLGQGAELRLTGQAFSGWDPANAEYELSLVADHTWELELNPGPLTATPYKLTLDGGWAVNWGGGASGPSASLARGGADATITLVPGVHTLRVTEGASVNDALQVEWIPQSPSEGVDVTFSCANGTTYMGQSVYVVGSLEELGNWDPAAAVLLGPTAYPTWAGTLTLPANTAVEWKCLKREETNPAAGVAWQGGANNTLTTPSTGTASVSAGF